MTEQIGVPTGSPSTAAPSDPARKGPSLLELRDVHKRYGAVRAVAGVSLTADAGELIAVLGPNGAGKTTLLSVIAGEHSVSSGTVHLAGRDITRLDASRRARAGIGRTFQVGRAFRTLTVRENVGLAWSVQSRRYRHLGDDFLSSIDHSEAVDEVLEHLHLSARSQALAEDLTQSELKRLDLAAALALRPKLLLLDEPTAGVGFDEAHVLVDLVTRIWRDAGDLTMIMISHDMRVVFDVAQRIVVMHEGKVIVDGTPDVVRRDEQARALYLGEEV